MPRVFGGSPGALRLVSQPSGRSASVYSRSTGTPEMVVKRAWPDSPRLMPEALPMGLSGAFFRAGSRACSSQRCFSTDAFDDNELICGASGMEFTSSQETSQNRGRRTASASLIPHFAAEGMGHSPRDLSLRVHAF